MDKVGVNGMITAEEAYARSMKNKSAKWPKRGADSRLTPICNPAVKSGFRLEKGESIFTIGSCFARNIEVFLLEKGYVVPALDFHVPVEELWTGTKMRSGILNKYTPHSMLNEIAFAFSDDSGEEFLVEEQPGVFFDTQLHADKGVSLERAIERRGQVRALYRDAIAKSRVVVVTLGLIESWYDAKTGKYLNETPIGKMVKNNPGRFHFEVISPSDATSSVTDMLRLMRHNGHPEQRVILTVSPVPLQRTFTNQDVLVANEYSKALLRVVAQRVIDQFDWVDYYPSYESVTLSDPILSWEDDLIHVKSPMILANVERMLSAYQQA